MSLNPATQYTFLPPIVAPQPQQAKSTPLHLPAGKRKAPADAYTPTTTNNGEGSSRQVQTTTPANVGKKRKTHPPVSSITAENIPSYEKFLTRLRLVNASEIAEYNFGKPPNLRGNPFASHWEQLDRQHQQLHGQVQAFINANPGTNCQNYVNAYTYQYNAFAQAGQATYMEPPHSLANRVNWLHKMLNKHFGPREPLSTPWDLLHFDAQQLLLRVGDYKNRNPGATNQDFIQSYTNEYRALGQTRQVTMEPPLRLHQRLTWVTGLLEYLQIHHVPPRF